MKPTYYDNWCGLHSHSVRNSIKVLRSASVAVTFEAGNCVFELPATAKATVRIRCMIIVKNVLIKNVLMGNKKGG